MPSYLLLWQRIKQTTPHLITGLLFAAIAWTGIGRASLPEQSGLSLVFSEIKGADQKLLGANWVIQWTRLDKSTIDYMRVDDQHKKTYISLDGVTQDVGVFLNADFVWINVIGVNGGNMSDIPIYWQSQVGFGREITRADGPIMIPLKQSDH